MIMDKKPKLNPVKNRILSLSPTVELCLEPECNKDDFFSESDVALGKGGFASVWKVKHKVTKKIYVVKVMSKRSIIDQKIEEQINREVKIMYKVNHPHIVKIYNHFEDNENIYLLLEFISKGQLYSLLKRYKKFDERTVSQYITELVAALDYLHSMKPPVIHRDIKPENVLINYDGRIKLADFGWSNFLDDERKTYCGTPEYLSPEMINKKSHDCSVDIWNVGVLIFELLVGKPPFSGKTQKELYANIEKNKIIFAADIDPLAKDLIKKILKTDPKERLSLKEIMEHAFFKKFPPAKPAEEAVKMTSKQKLETLIINKEGTAEVEDNEKTRSIIKKIREQSVDSYSLQKIIDKSRESLTKMANDSSFEINELKQEIAQLKIRNQQLQSELTEAREVNKKMNEMKEEIAKLTAHNNQRLELLSRLDEKELELIDLKLEIRERTKEVEEKSKLLRLRDVVIEENEKEIAKLKNSTFFLEGQMAIIKREKDTIELEAESRISSLQVKCIEEANSSEASVGQFGEIIKDMIQSATDNFNKKIASCREEMSSTQQNIELYKEFTLMHFSSFSKEISIVLSEYGNRMQNQATPKDLARAENAKIAWLTKQVAELTEYKTKSIALSKEMRQLEREKLMYAEKLELVQEMANLHSSLNADLNNKLKVQKDYNLNLEAKLSDVKNFVFTNCADQLDEFDKFYKINVGLKRRE